jgi:hypothetical protein
VGWTSEAISKNRPGTSVRAVGSLGEPEGSGGETGECRAKVGQKGARTGAAGR